MSTHETLLCFFKYVLSYRKNNWTIKDYPIRYAKRNVSSPEEKTREWSGQVIKWSAMFGSGRSKNEALKDLENSFERYRSANGTLPRPGTEVPIQFASSDQIEKLEDVAVEFFPEILGYDFHGIFVSDESSVFDFDVDEQETIAAINARYELHLTTLGDGNIVRILSLIKARKQ